MSIALISLFVSLLILGISGWTLYLSHYKENRSEVELLAPDSESGAGSFVGGSYARWTGHATLKVTNTGDEGAHIGSVSHEIVGLRRDDETVEPAEVALDTRSQMNVGDEIESHSTIRYKLSLTISVESDVSVLMEHYAAVIRHTLVVEDNKGSYEMTHDTEKRLIGPEHARERYKQELEG